MSEIADDLGLKLQHSVALWKVIIDNLITGGIDVICSAATITEKRKRDVAFSHPYLTFHLCVVSHKNERLSSKDLANKNVGVRAGTEAEIYLQLKYPDKKFKIFDSNEKQYESLTKKEVDAIIDDSPIAYGFTIANPSIVTSEIIGDTPSQYAIIINKENVELKHKIDNKIDKLKDK